MNIFFGEDRDDLKKDKLEEVAGEGENNTEDDLNQRPFFFVLFV